MMFAEIIHAKNAYLLLRIALITLAAEKNLLVCVVNFQVNILNDNFSILKFTLSF